VDEKLTIIVRSFLKNGVPQPLESGIDGHQRGDNLHAIMPGTATGVNLPGNLVGLFPMPAD
jgi:hypothetical protein